MQQYREILVSLAWRALFAAPFFVAAGFLIRLPFPFSVSFTGAVLIGCIILAFPAARLASQALFQFLYPAEHFDRPPPVYGIPESKVAKGLYEEAMTLYERIAEQYPEEIKPYLDMLEIAAKHLQDRQRTIQIYNRAIAHFPDPQTHALLKEAYDAQISRFDPVREWQQPGNIHLSEKKPDPGQPDSRYFPL